MSEALRAHLARVAAEARDLGRPLWASWREPAASGADPLALFAGAPGASFFWAPPGRGLALGASGEAARVESAGPARFADAAAAARALFADLRSAAAPGAGPAPPEAGPLLAGGFTFADAPSARGPWAWPSMRAKAKEPITRGKTNFGTRVHQQGTARRRKGGFAPCMRRGGDHIGNL